jgi:hypothetical protein
MERGSEVRHQTTLDRPTELIGISGDWGYAVVVKKKCRGVARRRRRGAKRDFGSLVSWWIVGRLLRQEQCMQPTNAN